AADFARRQADYAVAQTLITEAQQLYTAQQHDAGLAYALRQAGWLAYDRHDKAATLAAFQQSLALYRTLADPAGVADLLVCLVHFLGGVPEHRQDVQAYLAESLAIYQTLDHVEGIVHVLQQQGELEMAAGNYAVAQQHFADALQRWRALGVKWQIGWALALTGEAAWLQQDLATADRCYQEAYTIFVTLGNQDGIMILHHHLAQVARRRGEMTKAQAGYLESLSLSRTLDNQHMVARALIGLGGVALHAGSTHLAVRLFGAAQAFLDQLPPFLSPVDAAELAEMINAACTALGKVQFQEQWQAAQAMTLEEVLTHESIDAR
ncbi:MAG: hypothetical protein KDE53_22480, partial [Caldilineaceae bacterium]|nr:hypothetical protein [Caldilineaceae bacterium]